MRSNPICPCEIPNAVDHEEETIEDISESVEELRERLENIKRRMANQTNCTVNEPTEKKEVRLRANFIDANILSLVFGIALIVIISAVFMAFRSLYYAVLKKFPSHHTEL